MEPFPHRYVVELDADEAGTTVAAPGLPALVTAPPVQFGGPGDRWSPETLLVAAAADCFALTFRAVAAASHLTWSRLTCRGEGVLDRDAGGARFTALALHARLTLPPGGDADRAARLLEKAERGCLVSRSLAVRPTLTVAVAID